MLKAEKEIDWLLEEYLDPQKGLESVKKLFEEVERIRKRALEDQERYTGMIQELKAVINNANMIIINLTAESEQRGAELQKRDEKISHLESMLEKESTNSRIAIMESRTSLSTRLDAEVSGLKADFNRQNSLLLTMKAEKTDISLLKDSLLAVAGKIVFGKKKLLEELELLWSSPPPANSAVPGTQDQVE